jgi:hypothetical protein
MAQSHRSPSFHPFRCSIAIPASILAYLRRSITHAATQGRASTFSRAHGIGSGSARSIAHLSGPYPLHLLGGYGLPFIYEIGYKHL